MFRNPSQIFQEIGIYPRISLDNLDSLPATRLSKKSNSSAIEGAVVEFIICKKGKVFS